MLWHLQLFHIYTWADLDLTAGSPNSWWFCLFGWAYSLYFAFVFLKNICTLGKVNMYVYGGGG